MARDSYSVDIEVEAISAGLLKIAPPIFASLLRLPKGQEVIAARIAISGDIELLVRGPGLPAVTSRNGPQHVTLILHQEFRETHEGREYRTMANWEHDPEQRWLLRDWELESL